MSRVQLKISPTAVNVNELEHHEVVIVGTGFSGLLTNIYLKDAGITDIINFEKTPSVGGVWSSKGVGGYPGAACDVPSYTYLPMLDRTGFIPSKKYVSQNEISKYCNLLVTQCEIGHTLRFNRTVQHIEFLGETSAKVWKITTLDSNTGAIADVVTCKHVVTANGPLSSPRLPEIDGTENFQGLSFHSAKWPDHVNLKNKRVGVVGTGASAAQIITSIADDVEHLYVFQRTATWCMPRDDEPTPGPLRDAFAAKINFGETIRQEQARSEAGRDPQNPLKKQPTPALGMWEMVHNPKRNKVMCNMLSAGIKQQVKDQDLAKRLTPDYGFFCKRVLFLDDYYTTYNKKNVTLVDDSAGVSLVTKTGIQTGGGKSIDNLDVIIYATGFNTGEMQFKVTGKNGIDLATYYGANQDNNFQLTRPKSLWGMHVVGFPNMYQMIGPQSLNPLTNVTLLCEEQGKRIVDLVLRTRKNGINYVEPTETAVEQWVKLCNASSQGKVWLGCNNWYMKTTKDDEEKGRERGANMWMETYQDYLAHFKDGKGGTMDELLQFY